MSYESQLMTVDVINIAHSLHYPDRYTRTHIFRYPKQIHVYMCACILQRTNAQARSTSNHAWERQHRQRQQTHQQRGVTLEFGGRLLT